VTELEVRAAIHDELTWIFLAAMNAIALGKKETDPAFIWLREHGSEESRSAGVSPVAFSRDLVRKLAFDACARLPDPGQRTIVAIKAAIGMPSVPRDGVVVPLDRIGASVH
jgi:hypothetical protein